MDLTNLAIEKGLASWKRVYSQHPRTTIAVTLTVCLVFVATLAWAITQETKRLAAEEQRRRESLSYNQQLDSLNNVQASLNNLIAFVELQKLKLKESEDLLNNLRFQRDQLRPVVEADRKTVDAILELQAQRAETNVWRERGYGFVLGVLSSLLASLLIKLIKILIRRRKPPATAVTAEG